MNEGYAEESVGHLYALVRNKDGKPQFNDYHDIHPAFHDLLTEEDWLYIKEQRDGDNSSYSPA